MSLFFAALILVAAVSTMIAFRGFRGVQAAPAASQSVVVDAAGAREVGAAPAPTPGAVVIGGERRPTARQARRRPVVRAAATRSRARRTRTRVAEAPARSGLASPTPKPSPAAAAPAPKPASPSEPTTAPPPVGSPVDEVVEDVAGIVDDASPVEKVGDVLLELRDVLP